MQNGGVQSIIKTIQRGVTNLNASVNGGVVNVTIAAVNMAKTKVNIVGSSGMTVQSAYQGKYSMSPYGVLTTSTNLQFTLIGAGVDPTQAYVSWEIIEHY